MREHGTWFDKSVKRTHRTQVTTVRGVKEKNFVTLRQEFIFQYAISKIIYSIRFDSRSNRIISRLVGRTNIFLHLRILC